MLKKYKRIVDFDSSLKQQRILLSIFDNMQWWSYAWAPPTLWAVARAPHLILRAFGAPHLSLRATWPPQILLCT